MIPALLVPVVAKATYSDITWRLSLFTVATSGILLVFVAARSPRNRLTWLLMICLASILGWHVFELLAAGAPRGSSVETVWRMYKALCYTVLAPVFFHFCLRLSRGRNAPRILLAGAYTAGAGLLTVPLGGLYGPESIEPGFRDIFRNSVSWDTTLSIYIGILLVVSVLLLIHRYRATARAHRGVFLFAILATATLGSMGVYDLILDALGKTTGEYFPYANVGAGIAALLLSVTVLRYPAVFDAFGTLRESTLRLLSALHDGLVSFDGRGTVVFINEGAVALLGLTPRHLDELPDGFRDVIHDSGVRYVRHADRILRATAVRRVSPIRETALSHLLLEDFTPEFQRIQVFSHRESLATLGVAAANLWHEIRGRLSEINPTIDALSETAPPSVAQLERLRLGARRLRELADRSLRLAGPLSLDLVVTDLDALLVRICGLAAVPVTFEPGEGLPPVPLDPDRIRDLLDNLIRNAQEAGGTLIKVSTRRLGPHVEISVRNRGPTIPPHALDRIFEPFVTDKPDGTGLGLAYCRQIVNAHGGAIRAVNLEQGVEFAVELPWTS